jgi:hypothetical protein
MRSNPRNLCAVEMTAAVSLCFLALLVAVPAGAHAPSGAIFTTNPDGTVVNANIYPSKDDVYLDGGPGPNAPQDAAGLDDGLYVFQVTDPSGKHLLSEDPAGCRVVEVSEGVIVEVIEDYCPEPVLLKSGKAKKNAIPSVPHAYNTDSDHGPPAIVVQLMPYLDTPNHGGVYKAWMTFFEDYACDLAVVDCGYEPGNFHGFIPRHSKTDNFKVKERRHGPPTGGPDLEVYKYCDTQCNGVKDGDDDCLSGVLITVTDAGGGVVCEGVTVGGYFTCSLPDDGMYTVAETLGDDLAVCGASVDGVSQGATASVTIDASGAPPVVTFGNTATDGSIGATKTCDGSPVEGIQIDIAGSDVLGNTIDDSAVTGASGMVSFDGLAAGMYTLTEIVPPGWVPVGPTTCDVTLETTTPLDDMTGEPQCTAGSDDCAFQNIRVGNVGARTPGFWCVQVQRALGSNTSENAACYQTLNDTFGSIEELIDGAVGLSLGEAEQVLCPQAGDAEHAQCERQRLALLLNIAGYVNDDSLACGHIGTTTDQVIIVDGELTTVGAILDRLESEGCTEELHAIIQGINEDTITVIPCP